MCNRTKCIYRGAQGICDYLSKTGKSKLRQIAEEIQMPTNSEEVRELAGGKDCPFYRKRGEDEKPLQAVLAEMRFKAAERKAKKDRKFVPKLTPEEEKKISIWYRRGLSDTNIADKLHIPFYKVSFWRQKNKLESNFIRQRAFDEKKAWELYKQGKTDVEIGKALGRSTTTIYNWRRRADLEANLQALYLQEEKKEIRKKLYLEGKTDREIAELTGSTLKSIRAWRHYHKLRANDARAEVRYDREKMMQLYKEGMNDCQIARVLGCHSGTVGKWREKNGLGVNKTKKKKVSK